MTGSNSDSKQQAQQYPQLSIFAKSYRLVSWYLLRQRRVNFAIAKYGWEQVI